MSSSTKLFSGFAHSWAMYLYANVFHLKISVVCGSVPHGDYIPTDAVVRDKSLFLTVEPKINLSRGMNRLTSVHQDTEAFWKC
jgi:hypothetical protein